MITQDLIVHQLLSIASAQHELTVCMNSYGGITRNAFRPLVRFGADSFFFMSFARWKHRYLFTSGLVRKLYSKLVFSDSVVGLLLSSFHSFFFSRLRLSLLFSLLFPTLPTLPTFLASAFSLSQIQTRPRHDTSYLCKSASAPVPCDPQLSTKRL